jgi:hypothetical protein
MSDSNNIGPFEKKEEKKKEIFVARRCVQTKLFYPQAPLEGENHEQTCFEERKNAAAEAAASVTC